VAVQPGAPLGGRRGPAQVVVRATVPSRVVDTVPVTDRGWDRAEDAVVVPSRVVRRTEQVDPIGPSAPRPAEIEEVAGRQVHVVFRPSRGLEVADPQRQPRQPRRLPLQDGQRYTDTVVR
jgi:hypothetical protein